MDLLWCQCAGTIFICGVHAFTLIDTGATHSFISTTMLDKIVDFPEIIETYYDVMLPTGKLLHLHHALGECEICLDDRKMHATLIVMEMKGYDAILGMDWLCRYHATIDCRAGVVHFQ